MAWEPLPGPDGADPSPVGSIVERVLGHLGGVAREPLDVIFGGWDDLVGEPFAHWTQPQSLREGTLVVVVRDPALASSLKWARKRLIARIDEVTPGQVERIEIRVVPATP